MFCRLNIVSKALIDSRLRTAHDDKKNESLNRTKSVSPNNAVMSVICLPFNCAWLLLSSADNLCKQLGTRSIQAVIHNFLHNAKQTDDKKHRMLLAM